MILNLKYESFDYYEYLKNLFPNSYLTEDEKQIIIGIDCEYYDSKKYTYEDIRKHLTTKKTISEFAGLFGVISYDSIHFFEEIPEIKKEQYYFPKFIFADAKAYLHFDKFAKVFSLYSTDNKYLSLIQEFKKTESSGINNVKSNILTDVKKERDMFYKNIAKAKEYIANGDIFQVVLSSQLLVESSIDPFSFYKELSIKNPSPYMFYFSTPYGDVIGSSPEILFKVEEKKIFIAPIAGTRPRGKNHIEDSTLAKDLLEDEKELAEHKMLIDLARNDIGKFSKPGSVKVENPMHIEYFQHVMHIVSNVYGELKDDIDVLDIISTVFPAGTLSGAPKIRAMEIISELEEYKRNVYGGGIGFIHYNGNSQIAIIIRTAFYKNRNYFIQSGAGIVYDSISENEYKEILQKRKSLTSILKIIEKEWLRWFY